MRVLCQLLNGVVFCIALFAVLNKSEKFFSGILRFDADAWIILLVIVSSALAVYISTVKTTTLDDNLIELWIKAKKADLRKRID